ncbi:MAG TPA: phage major capsid protein [Methylophilaceae bacterium]|nr:phage major capsid protein [Methylophilaceae bacterium]
MQPINKMEIHPMSKKTIDARTLKIEPNFRELTFSREAINQETRTVQLAFASEVPYERYWGTEILDCGAGSIRLDRLLNKAPLLFNHDSDELLGVVENVSLGADRICRATVRFGKGEDAEEQYQNVLDGILTKVSVGYMIHELVLEKESKDETVYRVTDWEPYEISMVTVPADDTVGVGRSLNSNGDPPYIENQQQENTETRESGFFNVQFKEKTMEKTVEQLEKEGRELADKLGAKEVEQKRRDALVEVGVKYADYLTFDDVKRAIDDNKSPYELQALVIERQKTKHSDTSGAHIGLSSNEVKQYSIARAVAAIVSGDWSKAGLEHEASQAAASKFGNSVGNRGFLLPFDVMASRAFTAGTAAEAGNLIPTDLRDDLFADVLHNKLALGNLGATMLFGLTSNIDIPRKTTGSTLAFLAETAAASSTQPATAKVSLGPKRISAYVDFSKQAVIQSAMAVEPMLRQDIMGEYSVQFENAGINGSGSGSNPRGIRNTSGIGSVVGGTNGAQINWGHIVGLESAVANVNAEPDVNAGYLVNTKTRGWLKQTIKATNLPFIWDNGAQPLNGYRAGVTNMMLSNLTKGTASGICSSLLFSGRWEMLVLATFGALELTLDETSQAINGLNRLVLNAYVDVGCRRPADFAVMDDALTS